MASVNKVILLGNVGRNPEVRTVGEAKVAQFSLATSETYKDKNGEKKEITEWHSVVAWRGLADIAEKYISSGTQLYIEGHIKTRSWENDKGEKRYSTDIIADRMQMLGGKRDSSPAPEPNAKTATRPYLNEQSQNLQEDDSDLPF